MEPQTVKPSVNPTKVVSSVPDTTVIVASKPVAPLVSPRNAANIPTITVLKTTIGYEEEHSDRCLEFDSNIRAFRRGFMMVSGVNNFDVCDWKLSKKIYLKMAEKYLDTEQNGWKFWPDSAENPYYNNLQYSKDRPV